MAVSASLNVQWRTNSRRSVGGSNSAGRDREINPRGAVRARLGLGVFDRPARIAVLLAQLGRLVRPRRWDAALLDVALLAVGIALLGRGDDRGIDDLAAHRQKPGRRER